MALDGTVISSLIQELNTKILNGRLFKISQPENDELILTVKGSTGQYRLLISAGASLPLMYLTQNNKQSPLTAPNFCMLLRKHINNGRIKKIYQPSLERVIRFEIEHLDDMGDLCTKTLIVELMGKHSNIIFCDDKDMIIDSIKHVSSQISSVREVLPGRTYFIPDTMEKLNPLTISQETFFSCIYHKPAATAKALYTSLTGISPLMAEEICYRASIDSSKPANVLSDLEQIHLFKIFSGLMEDMKEGVFSPCIIYDNEIPIEFSAFHLSIYEDKTITNYESISEVLERYYAERNQVTRIRQRSIDLRRIVQTALEKNYKKYDLQLKQLKDTEKRDKYKVYGELITTYGYSLEPNAKSLTTMNYYTNEEITIPLDETLTPIDNAKKYFEKYSKLKRTHEALSSIIHDTKDEIEHLETISTALDIAIDESDLTELKQELIQYGYIKKRPQGKKIKITSKPFHYVSSDGYHMYVGKNNYQNDELTFNVATGNDWWFHAKGIPGSHVIVKAGGQEIPDSTFEEAGRLAAYYSKGREQDKVEIDYVQRKHVKKANGGKPGFVIYHTNYSLLISPNISQIKECK